MQSQNTFDVAELICLQDQNKGLTPLTEM